MLVQASFCASDETAVTCLTARSLYPSVVRQSENMLNSSSRATEDRTPFLVSVSAGPNFRPLQDAAHTFAFVPALLGSEPVGRALCRALRRAAKCARRMSAYTYICRQCYDDGGSALLMAAITYWDLLRVRSVELDVSVRNCNR